MKKLFFPFLLALVPFLLFGQLQRLGFNPASINLSKDALTGTLASFCADGSARMMDFSTAGRYKWFQNPGSIEVLVDGAVFAGGIEALIRTGDIIIDTRRMDEEIVFRLNPESNITSIQLNIKEPGLIADRPDDFLIENAWLGPMTKLKLLPPGVNTFEEAKPYIKSFQEAVNAPSKSGLPDGETRNLLYRYGQAVDDLISRGLLEQDFKSVDQVIEAYEKDQLVKEWDRLNRNPDQLIVRDFANDDSGKGRHLISNGGRIELWETDLNAGARAESPIARKTLQLEDILEQERRDLQKVMEHSASSQNDKMVYCVVGSLDMEQKSVKIFFHGEEKEITWTGDSFEAIATQVKSELEKLDSDVTVVFSRDELQLGAERFDKSDPNELRGDPFHNLQYVPSRQWINYTELICRVKELAGDRKIAISNIRYIGQDAARLRSTPLVRSGRDIIAFTAPESFGVQKDQVLEMRLKLTEAQISVLEAGANTALSDELQASNVIFLSGHKDANMEAYIRDLADRGLLKDKVVVGFSCYEKGTTSLHSYVLSQGDAKQVLFFPTQITPHAVKAVLYEMVEIINKRLPAEGLTLEKLLYLAVDGAMVRFPDLVPELELIRFFIPQFAMHSTKKIITNG